MLRGLSPTSHSKTKFAHGLATRSSDRSREMMTAIREGGGGNVDQFNANWFFWFSDEFQIYLCLLQHLIHPELQDTLDIHDKAKEYGIVEGYTAVERGYKGSNELPHPSNGDDVLHDQVAFEVDRENVCHQPIFQEVEWHEQPRVDEFKLLYDS